MTGDLDREDFVAAVAARFVERAALTRAQARDHADATLSEMLDNESIAFGDPEYGWTAAEASELADDELSHWEAA